MSRGDLPPDLCVDCGAELHPTMGMFSTICPDCSEDRRTEGEYIEDQERDEWVREGGLPDLPGHGPSHEEFEP